MIPFRHAPYVVPLHPWSILTAGAIFLPVILCNFSYWRSCINTLLQFGSNWRNALAEVAAAGISAPCGTDAQQVL
jgi:hypothetical protein